MDTNQNKEQRIADFLFEVGTMRKLFRMHRQTLMTDDASDNIASHSYRVAMIGWMLAKEEGVDASKVVMMCLLHDMDEIRSNDHNWIHKKYVKVFEEEIAEDQLGTLPHKEFKDIWDEYHARESKEAIVAKDADIIDQVLLLKEYEWQGNKEATVWLRGKESTQVNNRHLQMLQTESAKHICEAICDRTPSDWWNNLWTSERRES